MHHGLVNQILRFELNMQYLSVTLKGVVISDDHLDVVYANFEPKKE